MPKPIKEPQVGHVNQVQFSELVQATEMATKWKRATGNVDNVKYNG